MVVGSPAMKIKYSYLEYLLIFFGFVLSKCFGNKYNVLFVVIDDLRPLADQNVHLPNIYKLARKGLNFKSVFAQQSLCAPSRNSMLTGRRPDSLQLYDFYSYWRETVGNYTTMPQFFKEKGYDTYSVGKIFHPGKSSNYTDDYPFSWSTRPYHPPTEMFKDDAVCKDRHTKKFQKNLICPVNVHQQPGNTLPDLQSLEYAINILERNLSESKPVFLAVGFHKPHIPLKFPKEYLAAIPLQNVTLPTVPYMPQGMPVVSWHPWTDVRDRDDINRLNITFPFGTMPNKWSRKIKQSYIAAALYIDDLIGILMSYVDTRNTIVVLTSDHGWSLGENGLWAKYSNFDVALRVPLVINAPGIEPKEITAPVELIDIFPTLVDIAFGDENIPKCRDSDDKNELCFEGKSLLPLIDDEQSPDDYVAMSQYPRPSVYPERNSDKPRLKDIKIMGYSIRTRTLRYTEWISFNSTCFHKNWKNNYGIELYNHTTDPTESKNLYLDPYYLDTRKELSALLRTKVG